MKDIEKFPHFSMSPKFVPNFVELRIRADSQRFRIWTDGIELSTRVEFRAAHGLDIFEGRDRHEPRPGRTADAIRYVQILGPGVRLEKEEKFHLGCDDATKMRARGVVGISQMSSSYGERKFIRATFDCGQHERELSLLNVHNESAGVK